MKMTGVEVPFDVLSALEPGMVFVVIVDKDGANKLIKIDNQSFVDDEVVLRVTANTVSGSTQPQSGCYVWIGGKLTWVDPCPR